MKNNRFVWDDNYSVNVKIIDEQHKNFFNIINRIYDLAEMESPEKADLVYNVTELGNYAFYHLSTEEKYFKEFEYKEAEEHIKSHNVFRGKATGFMDELESADANLPRLAVQMADFCKDWLTGHILVLDKKYTKCFNDHGLNY